jgi:hypothetical protein
MAWDVEFTDEFGSWWDVLSEDEQKSVNSYVILLEQFFPGFLRRHD